MEKEFGIIKNIIKNEFQQLNYGFISHRRLGDLFFHHKSIDPLQNKNDFIDGKLVYFSIEPSRKHPGKLDATNVKIISNESDPKLLLTSLFETFYDLTISKAVKVQIFNRIKYLLEVTNDAEFHQNVFVTFENFIKEILIENASTDSIKDALNACMHFFPQYYELTCDNIIASKGKEIAHQLWMEKIISVCQVSYIVELILSSDEALKVESLKALKRCTENDKSLIFIEVIDVCSKRGSELPFIKFRELLKIIISFAPREQLIAIKPLIEKRSIYEKLILWINGDYNDLDFDAFKKCIYMLSTNDQKKFVKKTLKYIHEGKITIGVSDLISLNVISYDVNKSPNNTEGIGLDYSTSIVLNTIADLHKKTEIRTSRSMAEARNRMFNIILDQIKDPKDILEISGYFDECRGRTVARFKSNIDESMPREVELIQHKNSFPKFHPICDGRRAQDKHGNPVLDKNYNLDFWWCANIPCFQPSRKAHSHEEWESYSLYDFLKILNVDFDEVDLVIYLSIINKANLFLKHLKCRACGHILRPKKQSNYAFYGVNNFYCTNQSCEESTNPDPIYLSHCMNGNCNHIVDSRDTARCEHGWYICTYCYACCTTSTFKFRSENLRKMGQEYNGPINGHRDLGEICCATCGIPMEPNSIDLVKYDKALNWFVNNCDGGGPHIGRYGENRNGRRWFIFKRAKLSKDEYSKKVKSLKSLGFNVPDADDKDRDYQLISESIDIECINKTNFHCMHCNITIDLSSDRERFSAIKSFHNFIFPRESLPPPADGK